MKKQNRESAPQVQFHPKLINSLARRVKTWSVQEDEQLLRLYDEFSTEPKKWSAISNRMKDRNDNQCLHRYRRIAYFGGQKKIWSTEEDQTVINLVKKFGKNWKLLSELLGTKNGKQIRERFINKLDPKIKTQDWSEQEDLLILKCYVQIGGKWSKISQQLPGRPENKVKNRFYSYIQKNYEIKYSEALKTENQQNEQPLSSSFHEQQQKLSMSLSQKLEMQKNPVSQKDSLPSIKNMDEQPKKSTENLLFQQDQEQNSKKFGLQSLIKVDESLPQISESRYRSVKSLESNNDLENEKDLFELLHQS